MKKITVNKTRILTAAAASFIYSDLIHDFLLSL